MNQATHGFSAPGAEDRVPNRRAQAKQQTRDKVLQAAKRLFISRGYEAATIRDIAQEAGMSTGAVFANFTDKTHLFHEVMDADAEAQRALFPDVTNHPGPVEAAIAQLFRVGYQIHLQQLPLLRAATSLSWSQGLHGERGDRPQYARATRMVRDVLGQALARGELSPRADLALLADMLWDAYLSNYRFAVYDGWDLQRLTQRFDDQMSVILAGARA